MKFETNIDDFHKEQDAVKHVNANNAHIVNEICSLTKCMLEGAICKDELADQVVMLLNNNHRLQLE